MGHSSIIFHTVILLMHLICAKCSAIVFQIGSCDVQVYYEIERPALKHNYQYLAINQATCIPITSKEFTETPFQSLLASAEADGTKAKLGTVRKFQLNCHIIIIFFTTSHLERHMDFSSIRNPKLVDYSRSSEPMRIESENTYIIPVAKNSVKFQLNQFITGFKLKTFKSRMVTLSGQYFKVGYHELNPHYFTLNGRKYGTSHEFMEELSSVCNFTYSASMIPLVVTQLPDGTLSGWENEVVYGRIDAEIFYVANYVYNRPTLEFTTPIWKATIIYVAKVPSHRLKWTAILGALKLETWFALGVVSVIFGLIAYTKLRLSSAIHHEQCTAPTSVISCLVYTPLVSQGTGWPTRIQHLSLLWIFCAIVMTNYFTSNLLSLITSPAPEESVPGEMVSLEARQDYQICALNHPGGPLEVYFNGTTTPHLRRLWERTKLLPMDTCVLEAITTPKTVCMGWDFLFEAILQANATINEMFNPAETVSAGLITVFHSVIVRKNSFYADAFSEAAGWFRDTGIYESWLKQITAVTKRKGREWLTAPEQKATQLFETLDEVRKRSAGYEARALGVSFMVAPAVAMAVGMIMGAIIFIFEKGRSSISLTLARRRQPRTDARDPTKRVVKKTRLLFKMLSRKL